MAEASTARPLRRSLFFVPGGETRKLEKSRSIGADTLLLDLEDSVALDQKDVAREQVAGFLREGDFGGAEPAVRVNPPGTPFFQADVEAVIAAGVAALMIPKCHSAEVLREVHERVGPGDVRLLALVETASGIVHAASVGAASPRVDALCFGHADFSRDLGLARADASHGVVLHARCALVIAARAAGVVPVDTVYLDVRDSDGFQRDAELGRELGFEGKLCIHPGQVEIANRVHTPSAEEIAYAQRVVDACREAEAEGRGVFTVDGKMADAPLVAAQHRVLERARRAGVDTKTAEREEGNGS